MKEIYHITPRNDLEEHLETSVSVSPTYHIHCACKCDPEIQYLEDRILIIHNSYDGREGVEWANDVLKQK